MTKLRPKDSLGLREESHASREQSFLTHIKRGGQSLYDALVDARAIYDDTEFHAWRKLETIEAVEEYLRRHLDCVAPGITVGELLGVLAVFPDRRQWGEKSLVDMLELAAGEAKKLRTSPPVTRERVSRKDLEKAQQDASFFKSQSERLQSQLSDIEQENQRLREENLILTGRETELERLVSKNLQLV